MSDHFVCTGDCKTVSETPGVCQAEFCSKNGKELTICGCEDGGHNDAHQKDGEASSM